MEQDRATRLFSYGTLRQPEVQRAVFGRILDSRPDALPGFVLAQLPITDPEVVRISGSATHPILRRSADPAALVEGAALSVTAADLVAADAYEVAEYRRALVLLSSGETAYVYLDASER